MGTSPVAFYHTCIKCDGKVLSEWDFYNDTDRYFCENCDFVDRGEIVGAPSEYLDSFLFDKKEYLKEEGKELSFDDWLEDCEYSKEKSEVIRKLIENLI